MKLLFRYLVATVMVPVGGVLGVLGAVQNRMRRQRYDELYAKLRQDLENPPDGS